MYIYAPKYHPRILYQHVRQADSLWPWLWNWQWRCFQRWWVSFSTLFWFFKSFRYWRPQDSGLSKWWLLCSYHCDFAMFWKIQKYRFYRNMNVILLMCLCLNKGIYTFLLHTKVNEICNSINSTFTQMHGSCILIKKMDKWFWRSLYDYIVLFSVEHNA